MLFFLYMTTLLCKSLFPGQMVDYDGNNSRYGWNTTI
jgi:hypothetical protein